MINATEARKLLQYNKDVDVNNYIQLQIEPLIHKAIKGGKESVSIVIPPTTGYFFIKRVSDTLSMNGFRVNHGFSDMVYMNGDNPFILSIFWS